MLVEVVYVGPESSAAAPRNIGLRHMSIYIVYRYYVDTYRHVVWQRFALRTACCTYGPTFIRCLHCSSSSSSPLRRRVAYRSLKSLSGGVTHKRRCTYRPSLIYLIVDKLLSLSLSLSLSVCHSLPPLSPFLPCVCVCVCVCVCERARAFVHGCLNVRATPLSAPRMALPPPTLISPLVQPSSSPMPPPPAHQEEKV